jgi:MoaA/NifB/PqqE/SkfB family radical SAM enzyme
MTHKRGIYSPGHIWSNINYLSQVLRRKPAFLARLAQNYVKLFTNPKRPPLRLIDVALTYKCNFRCSHCSALVMDRADRLPLTVAEYQVVAKKLLKAGTLVVNFTGGEPFVRRDIYEVIAAFEPSKTLIAVQTNASLVTEERLRKLREIGVDSIGVSIDGADPETHDSFRKHPGAFEKAVRALQMAKELGFNLSISYCLTHDNIRSEDREKVEELSKEYGTYLNYNLAVPIGFWAGKFDGLITPSDRQYLLNLLEEYPQSKTDFETTYFQKGCAAIKEKLYITAYGEVMPCPFIQVGFGNLVHEDVEVIRGRALQYKYFSDYAPVCLAAEDKGFILNTRCYSEEVAGQKMPIPYTEAFVDPAAARGNGTYPKI